MIQPTGALVYDFNKSYYENVYSKIIDNIKTQGPAGHLFKDTPTMPISDKYWYDTTWGGAGTEIINGITVDNGINIRNYVVNIYNGDQPLCMIDKIFKEITGVIAGILPKDLSCGIGQIVYDIIDSFTDLFGTFICTATVNTLSSCSNDIIRLLKEFRDDISIDLEDSKKILKYYTVVGPKIVNAIDNDVDKDHIYRYLGINYIVKLVEAKSKKDKENAIKLYFTMLDEMVKRYNIKTIKSFDTWVERYT